jgi:hypothetical protein
MPMGSVFVYLSTVLCAAHTDMLLLAPPFKIMLAHAFLFTYKDSYAIVFVLSVNIPEINLIRARYSYLYRYLRPVESQVFHLIFCPS